MILAPVNIGSPELMGDFVKNEHIIDTIACLLPKRQSKTPSMDVKASSIYFFVFNYDVLHRKTFSKHSFDFKINCHTRCVF